MSQKVGINQPQRPNTRASKRQSPLSVDSLPELEKTQAKSRKNCKSSKSSNSTSPTEATNEIQHEKIIQSASNTIDIEDRANKLVLLVEKLREVVGADDCFRIKMMAATKAEDKQSLFSVAETAVMLFESAGHNREQALTFIKQQLNNGRLFYVSTKYDPTLATKTIGDGLCFSRSLFQL